MKKGVAAFKKAIGYRCTCGETHGLRIAQCSHCRMLEIYTDCFFDGESEEVARPKKGVHLNIVMDSIEAELLEHVLKVGVNEGLRTLRNILEAASDEDTDIRGQLESYMKANKNLMRKIGEGITVVK